MTLQVGSDLGSRAFGELTESLKEIYEFRNDAAPCTITVVPVEVGCFEEQRIYNSGQCYTGLF